MPTKEEVLLPRSEFASHLMTTSGSEVFAGDETAGLPVQLVKLMMLLPTKTKDTKTEKMAPAAMASPDKGSWSDECGRLR